MDDKWPYPHPLGPATLVSNWSKESPPMSSPSIRRSLSALMVATAVTWGVAACGSSSSPTAESTPAESTPAASPSPSASPACADLAALEKSLVSLKDVDLKQDGLAALTSAVAQVKTDLAAAKSSVSSAAKPSIDAVTTALDALQTTTAGLTTDNLVRQAPAIATALQQVAITATDLAEAVTKGCPKG